MGRTKNVDKVAKVSKTRVTLVGNVDMKEFVKSVQSSFPGVQVKPWSKRGKAQKKKTTSEVSDSTTQEQSPTESQSV